MTKISVIMTVYNGEDFLAQAIESILNQSYSDFEFLIINEFGSNEKSTNIIYEYAKKDDRIKIIQNNERLGIANSLNIGLELAESEYIARMDADDISCYNRFEKQVKFMDENPEIGVCGAWEYSLKSDESIGLNKFVSDHEELKCMMIFGCEISHATVFLRNKLFKENNWRYNCNYMSEDYELWLRIIDKTKFANIPEPLVYHRWGFGNISIARGEKLAQEVRILTSDCLKKLGINICPTNLILNSWRRKPTLKPKERLKFYELGLSLLNEILNKNKKIKYFNENALNLMIVKRKKWLEEIINKENIIKQKKASLSNCLKALLKFDIKYIINAYHNYKRNKIIIYKKKERLKDFINNNNNNNLFQNVDKNIYHLNNEIKEIKWLDKENRKMLIDFYFEKNKAKYEINKKIKVYFLFQIPSFWPSWKSIYDSIKDDERFEIVIAIPNFESNEKAQSKGIEEFLKLNNIKYEFFNYEKINIEKPHIMFIQSPYDGQRPRYISSDRLKKSGQRIVYITYGIEISDLPFSRNNHFHTNVINNSWRIYTFSEKMREDYYKYNPNIFLEVKALGHPKFDSLFNSNNFNLDTDFRKKINGRKIVLWKLHFFSSGKNSSYTTPELAEYYSFSKLIKNYKNLFFIIMLHPKYYEMAIKNKVYNAAYMIDMLRYEENVFIHQKDDYQIELLNSDYIITDRSAVMIEASVTGNPILYMYNNNNPEPLTEAVQPIVNSYYQGSTCEDIINFLNMCIEGKDEKKEERYKAFKQCIPFFDGKSGERIKEDIINGLMKETN